MNHAGSESGAADVELLARRAAAGDQAALHDLLTAIQPRVMRLCARILPIPQDAEEACQDALLKVATRIGQFEGRSRFTTWLHTVTSNQARQTYRALKRRAAEQPADKLPANPDPRTTSVIAGSRLDLLEALEALERKRPELVEPLVLRDVAGLDYAEIARQLGSPVGTVKSRVHDARKLIRPLLTMRD
ncbi:MAG: sigma-70 family RNA polymerase sigma factor [Propionibacteriales bacterium]|nr:sigma-70 family RNA polymerase sigma factor [Propionibacteriales bacterium]